MALSGSYFVAVQAFCDAFVSFLLGLGLQHDRGSYAFDPDRGASTLASTNNTNCRQLLQTQRRSNLYGSDVFVLWWFVRG